MAIWSMLRPVRLLRSWLKQERQRPLERVVIRRAIGLSLILITPLVGLQLLRRSDMIQRQQQASRDDTLALMEAALSITNRAARDWGHWDDAYRFARGLNPDYERNNLDSAALFDGGAIMVMLRPDGSPQLVHAAPAFRLPSYRELIRCAQDNRERLPTVRSTVRLACLADNGELYLGSATQLSNNDATAPSAGTLVMFDPLLRQEYRAAILKRLATLRQELVFVPASQLDSGTAQPIQPPIHSSGNALLAMRPVELLPLLARSLLDDLPLLLAIPLLVLLLRMLSQLAARRQSLQRLQIERRANQRIRRTCRELDRLLDGLLPGNRVVGEGTHILGRLSREVSDPSPGDADQVEGDGSRLERVTHRFQRFLRSASSLALLDSLTQLPNRRYFIEQVADAAEYHSSRNSYFAILFIDVDKFKVINDTYGHSVGDAVLVTVTQRLRRVLRSGDFMARYGGDELAVILDLSHLEDPSPDTLNAAARDQARAMVSCLVDPVVVGDLPIAVSLSIGITLVDPEERDIAAVIQRSDLAMYQAKRSRSSRIFGPDDVAQAPQLSSYQLFTDLIQAIRNQQLQVFFQAIVDVDGHPRGVEALARWQHPQRGWIEPMLFLEMAEQHRQTQLLGQELIRLSLDGFQKLRQWHPELSCYLNLTPIQLLEPDLAERILQQLHWRSLPPSQLTIELTEHSILEPHDLVRSNLGRLRGAGIRLALDDFGSGYSSLVLLRTLRPDVVKIDKTFIQAMDHDPDVMPIIRLIADLAPQLQLELIAEGIEDPAIARQLAALGIPRFQGFALGRPLPLQEWLAAAAASRAIA